MRGGPRPIHSILEGPSVSHRTAHVRRSRNGRAPHIRRLYRNGAKSGEERAFERRYGTRGRYVYGATVGKVRREQAARRGH
jgi:hypothetical protein